MSRRSPTQMFIIYLKIIEYKKILPGDNSKSKKYFTRIKNGFGFGLHTKVKVKFVSEYEHSCA